MDFWNSYTNERITQDFGSKKLLLNTAERYNASLNRIRDTSSDLALNTAISKKHATGLRYVAIKGLTFDLIASFYDVNSTNLLMARFSNNADPDSLKKIKGKLNGIKNPNIEIRIIGLQNEEMEMLNTVDDIHKNIKGKLVEIDLFGNETRHVAIDLKTGRSYNLLLENRIYRPGELVNQESFESFKPKRSKLNLV